MIIAAALMLAAPAGLVATATTRSTARRMMNAVISDIQTTTGMRSAVIPGARGLTTVAMRFTAVAMLPTLVTIRSSTQMSVVTRYRMPIRS